MKPNLTRPSHQVGLVSQALNPSWVTSDMEQHKYMSNWARIGPNPNPTLLILPLCSQSNTHSSPSKDTKG